MTNWQRIRQQVLERDEFICQNCGCTNRLDIHHKIPKRKGGLDIIDNLLTLCRTCHITLEPRENGNGMINPTTVKIHNDTHRLLIKIGGKAETFDDVIRRLIEFYEKGAKK